MTPEENKKFSYFFFISSLVFFGLLIHVLLNGSGLNRIITAFVLTGFIYYQLKTALLLYRSSKRND